MSVRFVLRAGERGYSHLPSVGPNASYVAGHPDGAITRHSSFNFHEYQAGIPGFGAMKVFGDEVFTPNGTGYNMHPHHNFIIMAVVLDGTLTHINTIGRIDELGRDDYYVFSAGSGGKHSELNIGAEDMQAIYVWVLPARLLAPPSYRRARYDRQAGANRIACLVGDEAGALPIDQTFKAFPPRERRGPAPCLAAGESQRPLCLRAGGRGRDLRHDPDAPRQHRAGGRGCCGHRRAHQRHGHVARRDEAIARASCSRSRRLRCRAIRSSPSGGCARSWDSGSSLPSGRPPRLGGRPPRCARQAASTPPWRRA